jgi:peptidoglycan/xylan/chitin deacetylase (PgdA/CDA1 family)
MTAVAVSEPAANPIERLRHNIGLFLPLIVIGGIAAAALTFYLGLESLGWRERPRATHLPAVLAWDRASGVTLYASRHTARYLAAHGGSYEQLVAPWRTLLRDNKIAFRELSEPQQLDLSTPGVLILPSAIALDDKEREQIRAFLARGGSVVATWATGTRDGAGQWFGHGFVEELFGVRVHGEVTPDSEETFLMPSGESPVTHRLAAGRRLWIGKLAEKPLRLEAPQIAARYFDWARTVKNGVVNGAIAYGERDDKHHGARWALLGFAETAWTFQPAEIGALIGDLLDWLQHRPAVALAAWPHPYRAANLIEMDTEHGFPNALRFAREMERGGFTATFYCLTSEAVKHPDVVHRLAKKHEIAYHADIHTGFKDRLPVDQAKRLDEMIGEMRTILGNTDKVTGFRAPTESYDATTEQLLVKKGITHHTADPSSTEVRLPFLSKNGPGAPMQALVVLPRTQRDDINYLETAHNPETLARALIADFDLAVEMGGLALLSVHTQHYDPASDAGARMIAAMPKLIQHAAQQRERVWTTNGGAIAEWWRSRERVRVTSARHANRLEVNVTVAEPDEVKRLAVLVMNPAADALPQVRTLKAGSPTPRVERLDPLRSALVFEALGPGHHSYMLTY